MAFVFCGGGSKQIWAAAAPTHHGYVPTHRPICLIQSLPMLHAIIHDEVYVWRTTR